MTKNPLLNTDLKTHFGIPDFKAIKPEHYLPAIENSISTAKVEIQKIAYDNSPPDFHNTIEALENCGKELNRIAMILFNLNSAETNEQIQEITQKASPILTRFSNDITLNDNLFKRIKKVYDTIDKKKLSKEESILLMDRYRSFKNGGAELEGNDRIRFREISEELSKLTVKFEENLLAETNAYKLQISNRDDLDGLPDGIIEAAAEEASSRDMDGWVFTLNAPSYLPFMQYASNRSLREKILKAYSTRCFKENNHDNRSIVLSIVNLRLELANILGYKSYADFILEDRMANSSDKVNSFLDNLHRESFPFAEKDFNTISAFAKNKGFNGEIERWDWAYYSEWLKREKHSIDDEVLRPYFKLENVEKAVFELAGSLFDITFKEVTDADKYHKDVRTWKVSDAEGEHIAILMTDYHPRKGKVGGAWMTSFREQYLDNGVDVRPVVSIVMNFSKPTQNKPPLITHNEVTTLLHEFGHALHGMLSKCRYESNSGTNVKRDFVELPSQIMENFAFEKEWLRKWAYHYTSGIIIPDELIDKIKESHNYNEGYACNRQLSFGILDMSWHSIKEKLSENIEQFENRSMGKTNIFPLTKGTNMSCSFGHLFSGGYAAGYYGYKWAEVLDADAFSVFKSKGIFDRETAMKFRKSILEKGGGDNPSSMYLDFKGSGPTLDAFLERSGFRE